MKTLRVGHLMIILQIQSMTPEQTAKNTRLFAENVLPKIRDIWDDEGWVDHWWPSGATRYAAKQTPARGNGNGSTRLHDTTHDESHAEAR